jgi:putative flippase GtrA
LSDVHVLRGRSPLKYRKVSGEFLKFIAVGVLSTLLDALTYRLCLGQMTVELAKATGYLVGMSCSILCNYLWTFGKPIAGSARLFGLCLLLYLTALFWNVGINTVALAVLSGRPWAKPIAFVAALGATTVYNFVGMKLIYRLLARKAAAAALVEPF